MKFIPSLKVNFEKPVAELCASRWRTWMTNFYAKNSVTDLLNSVSGIVFTEESHNFNSFILSYVTGK